MPPLRVSLFANYLGQGWVALMNIAFIPFYIRHLGIESYGLVGTFGIVVSSAVLFDAGMTPTLNREMARLHAGERDAPSAHDLLRSIELICAAVIALLILVAWATAPWLAEHGLGANHIDPRTLWHAIFLMVVAAAFRMVEGIYRGALMGLGRHIEMNGIAAAGATLRGAGAAAALIVIAPSIEVFFLWQAGASILSALALAIAAHRALPRIGRPARFDRAVIGEVRHFASRIMATTILSLLLTQVDKILLVRLLPLAAFAVYSVAATVANGLYQFVQPIGQAFYPRLCAAAARFGQERELSRLYHQGSQVAAVVLAPAGIAMILLGPSILRVWSGDVALAARVYPIMALLTVGTLLNTLMVIPYQLQLACGWPGLAARTNMVAVAVLIPALLILVPRYGAIAAAGVWIALNLGWMVYVMAATHRRLLPGEARRWFVEDIGAPIAGALAMGFAIAVVLPWGAYGRWGDAAMLVPALLAMFGAAALGSQFARARLVRLFGLRNAIAK